MSEAFDHEGWDRVKECLRADGMTSKKRRQSVMGEHRADVMLNQDVGMCSATAVSWRQGATESGRTMYRRY